MFYLIDIPKICYELNLKCNRLINFCFCCGFFDKPVNGGSSFWNGGITCIYDDCIGEYPPEEWFCYFNLTMIPCRTCIVCVNIIDLYCCQTYDLCCYSDELFDMDEEDIEEDTEEDTYDNIDIIDIPSEYDNPPKYQN